MSTASDYHSVTLDEASCKGCTICVTGCPAEAIRVREGKAFIIEERCIDCGECIRRCPHKAKRARASSLEILKDYPESVLLTAPSFYAQFDYKYSLDAIQNALLHLGFTHLFDVSRDAVAVTDITSEILQNEVIEAKPLISSACPAVIKLIQIRFPSLLPNILPVLPPVEISARRARKKYGENCGVFFISPCPAKITELRSPTGYEKSEINGSFSMVDIYVPLLQSLKTVLDSKSNLTEQVSDSYAWAGSGGEVDLLKKAYPVDQKLSLVCCDGIEQTISILENIEAGVLKNVDFVEISACSGGCIGGSLTVQPVPLARSFLQHRCEAGKNAGALLTTSKEELTMHRLTKSVIPRPALRLSSNFVEARKMMEKMETIINNLPGLDCGSCGSPNCRSLADDIVRGKAKKEDCIHILKQEYERLVYGK